MFKYLLCILLFLSISSCSSRFCEKDIYNGWLNGILCNYDEVLIKKKKELKEIEEKSDELKSEGFLLKEKKLKKKREENALLSEFSDLNNSNSEIEKKLKRMKHFKEMNKLLHEVQSNVDKEL